MSRLPAVAVPRWPLPQRPDLRDALVQSYRRDRGYHDLVHLCEVIDRIGELGAGDDVELVTAAWYHDAVYDIVADEQSAGADSLSNEERSARRAEAELSGEDVDVGEIGRLVRLTATHRPTPDDWRGAVLVDADLAILACPPERYAAYVAGVRAEYAGLDDATFAAGRIAVLRDLVDKPYLFHTRQAREQWEARARENVEAELVRLTERTRRGSTS